MPIIIGPRRKFRFKVSETEFILTKLLLENLYADFESDYKLSFNYHPIMYNDTVLHFAEHYASLVEIPNDLTIFRPLKNDKHASILIDMFEQLDIIETDSLTIMEDVNDKGVKSYSGFFTYKGKKVNKSYTYNAPNTAVLKSFMIAKLILDPEDYDLFINNLMSYNYRLSKNRSKN